MPEIAIDADKAERMIAQILWDDGSMLPAAANKLAQNISRRLYSAMATPTHAPLAEAALLCQQARNDRSNTQRCEHQNDWWIENHSGMEP
ncbi:hypothetical protein [Bradyrhizobium cenepequi]|uniref:hypothetical protein n=1 Tax=Bradyrhizobium cenepequi TaxID=2821403 RepID=UPI001CE2780A|nr:hypothetical protein [Bradyrhizobium cenepequi]MCA6112508.1 hypothetical protein [Bradyrhizobium cenepequi]